MKKHRRVPIVVEAEQWFKVVYDREAGCGYAIEDMPTYHSQIMYKEVEKGGQNANNAPAIRPMCQNNTKRETLHVLFKDIQMGDMHD